MDKEFSFSGHVVRHVILDQEPWFVASDVCRCLGLNMSKGTSKYLQRLYSEERRVITKSSSMARGESTKSLWGSRDSSHTLINESGLYKLILRSSSLAARQFQDWVSGEVLPAIRKTGGYLLNEDMRETATADSRSEFPMPANFSDALRKLADEIERREAAEVLAGELRTAREADRSKVEFHDQYVDALGTFSLRDAAKVLNHSPLSFNDLLRDEGVIFRNVKGENIAKAEHLSKRRFVQRTTYNCGKAHVFTRVTAQGMSWLAG